MFRRRFTVAACGALALLLSALLLTAAEAAPAKSTSSSTSTGSTSTGRARSGFGPGAFFFPGFGPSFFGPSGGGFTPYYIAPFSWDYSITYETTPLYYGAASLPGYSPSYSTARIVSPSPDVAYRTAYENQNYPVQAPNNTAVYPVAPPIAVVAAMTARVQVRVPDGAQIRFDGRKTSQTGTERLFTSPRLDAGQNYAYDVRAVWTQDGKTVDQTRKVAVRAGESVVVDFLREERRSIASGAAAVREQARSRNLARSLTVAALYGALNPHLSRPRNPHRILSRKQSCMIRRESRRPVPCQLTESRKAPWKASPGTRPPRSRRMAATASTMRRPRPLMTTPSRRANGSTPWTGSSRPAARTAPASCCGS